MYLVYDIGGSSIKYGLFDKTDTMIEKGKVPVPSGVDSTVEEFVEALGQIFDQYKDQYDIEGVALSLPGQIDVEYNIVYGGGALFYLDKVALGTYLKKRLGIEKIAMENDGKCAALAEVWKGNAKECQDVVVFVIGTGVGGGIIKNRRIHRGQHLCAGEFSYIINTITRDQLDAIRNVNEVKDTQYVWENMSYLLTSTGSTGGACFQYAKKNGLPVEQVTGEYLYRQAEQGDQVAQEYLEDWYLDLAKECCSMQAILDPEKILIGGGISAEPKFIEGIRKYVDIISKITDVYVNTKIEPCMFLNDSNLIGALFHYRQKYEE